MLQKESWVYVTDNTNIRWLKIFQLYKGFKRRHALEGDFVKGSARVVEPPRQEYKGFKYRYSVKGDINRALIVRTILPSHRLDNSNIKFNNNGIIIVIKKYDFKSKYLNGPISKSIRRKKIKTLFKSVL
uniref:Ribosomal protein L14 n=1 Tax=Strombidium cf. sulcatum TaxID=2793073 RepID=A0A7T0M4X7_9SPIT|nr:ribosomal protein L14 [Strombidium cf. sulcatum]QPL15972.1 ribosomal protein L14 [Strombidium cf. sulcatum]